VRDYAGLNDPGLQATRLAGAALQLLVEALGIEGIRGRATPVRPTAQAMLDTMVFMIISYF
jgi:hypothetical protein